MMVAKKAETIEAQTETKKEPRPKVDRVVLKRDRPAPPPPPFTEEPPKVSSPVDKVVDYAFNPSREKIREMTIIDKMQGRLFPLLDMIEAARVYIMEVAMFRYDRVAYIAAHPNAPMPKPPALIDEFMFRTAQWSKSIYGKNLERATDIALAETEMKGGEEDDDGSGQADKVWKD